LGAAEVKAGPIAFPYAPKVASYFYGDTIYARHWQIFYDDGSNSGYFGGLFIYYWGPPDFRPDEPGNLSRYDRVVLTGLNDRILKLAEAKVQVRWFRKYHTEGLQFDLTDNSCQTYVLDVLREYNKLKKQEDARVEKCSK